MTKTKEVIREILQHYNVEHLRSKHYTELRNFIWNNFYLTFSQSNYIAKKLKTYSADNLYFIYFPELR